MPKISVVMPIYNGEEFLPEAMDSIMQQTPSPIEKIKILYTNTNLPAALYAADGSVIWQNAAVLYLAQLFPCEEWSAAAVRETAARIAGNS